MNPIAILFMIIPLIVISIATLSLGSFVVAKLKHQTML
jgi:hypothetical protein